MEITKIKLDDLYRCYSTMAMELDGDLHLFYASEEKGYPCYAFSGENFSEKKVVWENGGGTMSMIPVPNRKNEFFAVMDFYLKETPSLAKLVWVKYSKENGFVQKDLFYLPYLHRFDLFEVNDELYFLGATIAEKKEHKEDWTYPGKIYVSKCPKNFNEKFDLDIIYEGLTRNHGYCRSKTHNGGYFSSDNGIMKVSAPFDENKQWNVEKIQDGQFSEIAFSDINNDGVDEMLTIEPFHGNSIKLYQLQDDKYKEIYNYPYEIDFAHTLIGTKIFDQNCFIGGIRRINPDLFLIEYKDDQVKLTIIDQGVGPANCNLYSNKDITLIHSANHTQNHAAVYIVKK